MKGKIIFPTLPSGYSIFCDDIRSEVTGKRTLVGTYGTHLFVSEIPSTLPKLCIAVVYRDEPDLTSEVTIRLLFEPADAETGTPKQPPENSFDEGEVVAEGVLIAPDRNLPRPSTKGFQMTEAKVEFQLAPYNIASPGTLKVRAYRDDLEIRLGALIIQHHEPLNQSEAD